MSRTTEKYKAACLGEAGRVCVAMPQSYCEMLGWQAPAPVTEQASMTQCNPEPQSEFASHGDPCTPGWHVGQTD
jgi:hypothetical protein